MADRQRGPDLLRAHGLGHSRLFYNKAIFSELGLTVPQTRDQFFAALDKVKADGRYVPLRHERLRRAGSPPELGFQNIGPNYWKGRMAAWR